MIIKGQEYLFGLHGKTYHCAMDVTMRYIGGKWKTVVLWYLHFGTLRFSEFGRVCPQITERMLSITLKQLENDGLVHRKSTGKKPPLKVEYSLTDFGRTLIPILEEVARWGREVGGREGELIAVHRPEKAGRPKSIAQRPDVG